MLAQAAPGTSASPGVFAAALAQIHSQQQALERLLANLADQERAAEDREQRIRQVEDEVATLRAGLPNATWEQKRRAVERFVHWIRVGVLPDGRPAVRARYAFQPTRANASNSPVVAVSVHRCRPCVRTFRSQPPFLRPGAISAERVVQKAVEAVYHDGLAIRRVPERLARDCHVRPGETMVRLWCRRYVQPQAFATDDQPWGLASFSGILCVDRGEPGNGIEGEDQRLQLWPIRVRQAYLPALHERPGAEQGHTVGHGVSRGPAMRIAPTHTAHGSSTVNSVHIRTSMAAWSSATSAFISAWARRWLAN